MLMLLPFDRLEPARIVELGSGPGTLSHAILGCFPNASLVALDGSESMRAHATDRLATFANRFEARSFDLAQPDWHFHKEAGFPIVDCFWLQAGHAIFGGFKRNVPSEANRVGFPEALRHAKEACRATA